MRIETDRFPAGELTGFHPRIKRFCYFAELRFIALVLTWSIPVLFPVYIDAQSRINKLQEQNSHSFREKMVIQTDRDIYAAGETVWLNIAHLNSFTGAPEETNSVVYAEILNRSGYPVHRIKLPVRFSAHSSIRLSDTLETGYYLIRAYTNWMKNFSQNDFGFKLIRVIHPAKLPGWQQALNGMPDTVMFFPEGGRFLRGLKTRTVIRGLDRFGVPQPVHGYMISGAGDTLARVDTEEGWRIFSFIPDEENFFVPDGAQPGNRDYPVGEIISNGFTLLRQSDPEHRKQYLEMIASGTAHMPDTGYVFARRGGVTLPAGRITPEQPFIPVTESPALRPGMSEIIVTDPDGVVLTARKIYKPPPEKLSIEAEINPAVPGPRQKATVAVTVWQSEKPVRTTLTVSVIKSGLTDENNIGSEYVPLGRNSWSSDIPALASNPVILSDFMLPAVDVGKPFPSSPQPTYLPEMEGKILSGAVVSLASGQPLGNREMFLSFAGKNARNLLFTTDDRGHFSVRLPAKGTQQLIIQPVKEDTIDYYVVLKEDFFSELNHPLPGLYLPDTTELDMLENLLIRKQIKESFDSQSPEPVNTYPDQGHYSFYGEPVQRIVLSDYIPLSDVREVIREIVPHVTVLKRNGKSYFRLISEHYGHILNRPLVLVDGTPYSDIDGLLSMPASQFEAIDVINLRFFFERKIFNGVLHFITAKGNLESVELDPGIFRITYPILDVPREFVPVSYDTETDSGRHRADYRNTVYWDPELKTGPDGHASFTFFTPDGSGDYTIVVEATTDSGIRNRIMKTFTVKEK